MQTIELFSGTKSFSKVMTAYGHSTLTVDNNPHLQPDVCIDIRHFISAKRYAILWASPPCTTFSVASIAHYWKDGRPKNKKAREGIRTLGRTIETISHMRPTWWFLENPRGMMRKIIDPIFEAHGISDYHRHTISYCQYGAGIMKPTDIWTNARWWIPRPICRPGAPCHEKASRGAKAGVQGIRNPRWQRAFGANAIERGRIPAALFEEILTQLPGRQREHGTIGSGIVPAH